jgi:hypothetical protein
MAQRLGNDNIPNIVKASSTSVTLAATNTGSGTLITIGGQQYSVSSTLTLNTVTVGANGLDAGTLGVSQTWYVYAVANQSTQSVALVASLTAASSGPTMPSGYGSAYAWVGGFTTGTDSLIADTLIATSASYPISTKNLSGTISTTSLTDKNRIQKKTLVTTVTSTSGATVQIPSLTFNNLVVGKNYRLHMHGYITIFVNAVGGAFSAIHNGSQLALVYYEGVASASNRWMASGTTQLFTAAATTVTFQFANTSGPNGSALSGGLSWVILEELNDTDLSTSF